ncbi:MAG: autoinducer binding domain-containing protein [Hyphomicrobiaceae bacterium]
MMRADYEARLLTLSPELDECRTLEEATAVAGRFARAFGLEHFASVRLCLDREIAGRSRRPLTVVASSFPSSWSQGWDDANAIDDDPVIAEAKMSGKSFLWSQAWLRRHATSASAIARARAHGIVDGFAAPMMATRQELPIVMMAGGAPALDACAQSALTLASTAIHRCMSTLDSTIRGARVRLTDRERQCLSWAAAGKSDWEIGQIVALSAKTVNYHIENAKRKSGVQTRVQAIVEALRSGVIA